MSYHWKIQLAKKKIQAGKVIAYPSEAVYGLGCDPANKAALQKLLSIKSRSPKKGLIIIASQLENFSAYIKPLTQSQLQLIAQVNTRATTWIVPAKENVSNLLCGQTKKGLKKIAIRLTQHPLLFELCEKLGHPIVSTSANLASHPVSYSALQVRRQFQDKLDYILCAPLGGDKKPSQIRDIQTGETLRL